MRMGLPLVCLLALMPARAMAVFEKVLDGGLTHPGNTATVSAEVFHDHAYVGTWNETKGCMVYRIVHAGGSWGAVEVTDWGFGVPVPVQNWTTAGMAVFDQQLYVGTWNALRRANLWRTKQGIVLPQGQQDWERVDPASFQGFAVTSLKVFRGMLYAGIYTLSPGCGVWRSQDGANWLQVNQNGFGNDQNTDATTMEVFGDHLYVGTENGHGAGGGPCTGGGTGTQIWRTDGETPDPANPALLLWEKVNPADGFGAGRAQENTTDMKAYNGRLFAGTYSATRQAELWGYDGSGWAREVFPPGLLGGSTYTFYYHAAAIIQGSLVLGAIDRSAPGGRILRYAGGQWVRLAEPGFDDPNVVGIGPILFLDARIVAGTTTVGAGCSVWALELP